MVSVYGLGVWFWLMVLVYGLRVWFWCMVIMNGFGAKPSSLSLSTSGIALEGPALDSNSARDQEKQQLIKADQKSLSATAVMGVFKNK